MELKPSGAWPVGRTELEPGPLGGWPRGGPNGQSLGRCQEAEPKSRAGRGSTITPLAAGQVEAGWL